MTTTFSAAERVESLKAALVCGTASGGTAAALLLAHRWQQLGREAAWVSLGQGLSGGAFWVSAAIAGLSGALFGLTYRYAVRQDANPQLKAGVVLAFGLVRGLAQVDAASALSQGWPFLAAVCEALLLFAIATTCLEAAFSRQWIKPFG